MYQIIIEFSYYLKANQFNGKLVTILVPGMKNNIVKVRKEVDTLLSLQNNTL